MHEYSLVQALLQKVEREARARGATVVHRVAVRIGPLAGVEPALFATAFGDCRSGTLCAGATLDLLSEDVDWRCDACGEPIPPGAELTCPSCQLPARLVGGNALTLERIEMEVPDHV